MRYKRLLNQKKWLSDRLKGSANPSFRPSHSVLLLCSLHPFSNLDFSGLLQLIFLKLIVLSPNTLNLTTDTKFLEKHLTMYILEHIKLSVNFRLLEWCLPQPTYLNILVCHSATSWNTPNYHTSSERGYSELSYDLNCFNIFGVITL